MIRSFLIFLISLPFITFAKAPALRVDLYSRYTIGYDQPETVLITKSTLDKETGYFLTYIANGKLKKKTALDRQLYDQLLSGFDRSISEVRQKSISIETTDCGQSLLLKTNQVERTMCLDSASPQEREAIAKWWKEIRTLLQI